MSKIRFPKQIWLLGLAGVLTAVAFQNCSPDQETSKVSASSVRSNVAEIPMEDPGTAGTDTTVAQPACTKEFMTNDGSYVKIIHFAYCYVLKRPAETEILSWRQGHLESGMYDLRGLLGALAMSDEAQAGVSRNNQEFVDYLYNRLLYRAFEGGVNAHVDALDKGIPRATITENFVYSPEMASILATYNF